jgi:FkbM family methyltransferase
MMKRTAEWIATTVFNTLYYLLKNRKSLHLSREEVRHSQLSFSQFGEDLAVQRWAHDLGIEQRIYLDIGAFDPVLLSNTLLLSKEGWRGINIDMNPQKVARFVSLRPDDDNICCAVSDTQREYVIENRGRTTERIRLLREGEKLVNQDSLIQSRTLESCLVDTIAAKRGFDYLNIDCEGHDFAVLRQVDFDKYSPSIITVEALDSDSERDVCCFLETRGYRLTEKIKWTLLFLRSDHLARCVDAAAQPAVLNASSLETALNNEG